MTKEEKRVADLMTELSSTFEQSNFEGVEHLASAGNRLNQAMQNGGVVRHLATEKGGQAAQMETITGLIASSVGDLNIIITRNSNNINEPLPFALFGLNDYETGYISTLKQYTPPGVVITVSTTLGNVIFTYTAAGPTVDTVTVSFAGSLNTYLQFLKSMNQNFFKTKYILYSISDVAQQKQFGQLLNFGNLSALGMALANQLSINSRIMTWDFKSDRANVLIPEQKVTAAFSFVQNIMPIAGLSIEMDMFLTSRVDMNKV